MNIKILFITAGIALCINTMGQIHKAIGDKPLFSHHYTFENSNDSVAETKMIYSYNTNNQLTKSISFSYFTDEDIDLDSIVRTYDANDRIISSINYKDGILYSAEYWTYDISNEKINYYCNYQTDDGVMDSLIHVSYYGVNDFDNVPGALISGLSFELILNPSAVAIDCDSIFFNIYEQPSWETMVMAYPVYQNGKMVSAKTVIKDFDISVFVPSMPMVMDITVNYTYNYDGGGKLKDVKGNIDGGVLLTIPNAIVITNQYDNNDLLIESTTETDITIPIIGRMFYNGTKQKYAYNTDNNISVLSQETSADGTSWEVISKAYYFYNENNVDDIAISIEYPYSQPDIVGESINIEILLENKNYLKVYENVNITALIEDAQGNQITTFTEPIAQIYFGVSMNYTFSQDYTVPDDSVYYLTVYIDSCDIDVSNDTSRQICSTLIEIDDIALNNIEIPSATTTDVVGESINIKVSMENKNIIRTYENVNITALIEDSQGNRTTFTETIDRINSGSKFYTFSQDYIVPDDSVYDLTIYIGSYDSDASNDTLRRTRRATPGNNIKTIDNSIVYISQNFPNPADNQTLITYAIPTGGQVTFSVYSINGQLLSSQAVDANSGENTWVLNTDKLAAGIYFYALEFNGKRIVKKMNVSR